MVWTARRVQAVTLLMVIVVPLLWLAGCETDQMETGQSTIGAPKETEPSSSMESPPVAETVRIKPKEPVSTPAPAVQPTPTARPVVATKPTTPPPTERSSIDDGRCPSYGGGHAASWPLTLCGNDYSFDWLEWTPDGAAILFAYPDRKWGSALYEVAVDGSHVRTVVDAPEEESRTPLPFDLSPDGTQLVYSRCECLGGSSISGLLKYVTRMLNLEDGSSRKLTHSPVDNYLAQWSPDGNRVAFVRDTSLYTYFSQPSSDNGTLLYVFGLDGTGGGAIHGRSKEENVSGVPAWSPDGSKIAFMCNRNNSRLPNLYVVGSDGSEPKRLSELYALGSPSWSPDGQRIAFFAVEVGDKEDPQSDSAVSLYSINADGTDLRTVFPELVWFRLFDPGYLRQAIRRPLWSPDGEHLLSECMYTKQNPDDEYTIVKRGMCTVDLDGNANVLLVANSNLKATGAWSPDGTKIAIRFDGFRQSYEKDLVHTMNPDGSDVRVLAEVGNRGVVREAMGRVADIVPVRLPDVECRDLRGNPIDCLQEGRLTLGNGKR